MDLLSSVRKSGSRGGVNFSWDEVASSSHRENYLGHSLKAPVGRWQKGRALDWYAKSDPTAADSTETSEAREERELKEEKKRIKEAEEDAIALALGLPPPIRNTTGANSVAVSGSRQIGGGNEEEGHDMSKITRDKEATKDEERGRDRRSRAHGDGERRRKRRHRSHSSDRRPNSDRRQDRPRNDERRRSRSRERHHHRQPQDGRSQSPDRAEKPHRRNRRSRTRSRSPERREHRRRSRSRDRHQARPGDGRFSRHMEPRGSRSGP